MQRFCKIINHFFSQLSKYPFTLLATLAVYILSAVPIPEVPEMERVPLIDKWVHFVMYGGLSLAVWIDLSRNRHNRLRHRPQTESRSRFRGFTVLLPAFGFPLLFGGLMELYQAYLTTSRSGDWWDWLADAVGCVLALPVGFLIYMRKK